MLHHNLNRVAIKSPWTILTLKRLDKERAQARQAAGVGSDDYVDDWCLSPR